MKTFLARLLLAAAAFLPTGALATYVYNTIMYPGAVRTDVRGITDSGRICGYASLDGITNFSFTYEAGVFTPLPALAFGTSALGMNDAGVVVGSTEEPSTRAFIYDGVSYTFFARAGWDHTHARAINNAGIVTGYTQRDATGETGGFVYNPATGAYTDIPVPPSLFTIAQGINTAGQVVGSAGPQSFLFQPSGAISFFQLGGQPTRARAINDSGLIAGWYVDAAGVMQGFVATSAGYQALAVPGAASTAGESLNEAGQVSGVWIDAAGVWKGFVATPAAMPVGTTSGGAYVFSVDVVPGVPIFIDPPVAVGYDYEIGPGDPLIASVRLPIGIGDNAYSIKVRGRKFDVAGGELFDFRANGFASGVEGFRVGCIEAEAALDPANPQAFPTELTFVAAGRFTGTQAPRTRGAASRGNGGCKDD